MGLFSRSEKPSVPVPPSNDQRLAELERKLAALESALMLVRGEWGDVYDQLMRQVQRIRRLQKVDGTGPQEGGVLPLERPQSVPRGVAARRSHGVSQDVPAR